MYKRQLYQIVESNRIESKNRFITVNRTESNYFPRNRNALIRVWRELITFDELQEVGSVHCRRNKIGPILLILDTLLLFSYIGGGKQGRKISFGFKLLLSLKKLNDLNNKTLQVTGGPKIWMLEAHILGVGHGGCSLL